MSTDDLMDYTIPSSSKCADVVESGGVVVSLQGPTTESGILSSATFIDATKERSFLFVLMVFVNLVVLIHTIFPCNIKRLGVMAKEWVQVLSVVHKSFLFILDHRCQNLWLSWCDSVAIRCSLETTYECSL